MAVPPEALVQTAEDLSPARHSHTVCLTVRGITSPPSTPVIKNYKRLIKS